MKDASGRPHDKNKKCFTCGRPCYGYQCREHKKKGKLGSPARREVNRRNTYKRYHENSSVDENPDAMISGKKISDMDIIEV